MAAQHQKRHDGERKLVGPAIDLSRHDLFRRHIGRRAEHHAGLSEFLRSDLGDAEIRDLGAAIGAKQDVGGLHVPVDDAGGMRVIEGGGDLAQDREDRGLLKDNAG